MISPSKAQETVNSEKQANLALAGNGNNVENPLAIKIDKPELMRAEKTVISERTEETLRNIGEHSIAPMIIAGLVFSILLIFTVASLRKKSKEILESSLGLWLIFILATFFAMVIGVLLLGLYKYFEFDNEFSQGAGSLVQATWGSAATIAASFVAILLALEALRQAKNTNSLQIQANLISTKQTTEYADIYKNFSALRDISSPNNLFTPIDSEFNAAVQALYKIISQSSQDKRFRTQLHRYMETVASLEDSSLKRSCITKLAWEYSKLMKKEAFRSKVGEAQKGLIKQVIFDTYVDQTDVYESDNIKLEIMESNAIDDIFVSLQQSVSIKIKVSPIVRLTKLVELGPAEFSSEKASSACSGGILYSVFPLSSRELITKDWIPISEFFAVSGLSSQLFISRDGNIITDPKATNNCLVNLEDYFRLLRPMQLLMQLHNLFKISERSADFDEQVIAKLMQYIELVDLIMKEPGIELEREVKASGFMHANVVNAGGVKVDLSKKDIFKYLILPGRYSDARIRKQSSRNNEGIQSPYLDYEKFMHLLKHEYKPKIAEKSVLTIMWSMYDLGDTWVIPHNGVYKIRDDGSWDNPESDTTVTRSGLVDMISKEINLEEYRIANEIFTNLSNHPLRYYFLYTTNSKLASDRSDDEISEKLLLLTSIGAKEALKSSMLAQYVIERSNSESIIHV